jgi:hypothetical protein
MKLFKIIIPVLIFSINKISAQTFIPGYYILNNTAEYSVVIPSGLDYYSDEEGNIHQFDIDELSMNWGEVVIAFENSKGKYFCFDPNGRLLVVQGENCLTKAPILPGSSVGVMIETLTLIDGTVLSRGSYYWIVGQNLTNSSIKIMLAEGVNIDIPVSSINLYGVALKNESKGMYFKKVDE